jgi:acyl-homoserine lactone acylase PvdQ
MGTYALGRKRNEAFEPETIPNEDAIGVPGTTTSARGQKDSGPALSTVWPSSVFEGFVEGKGSNNWAVAGSRSETGMPILAGDMHLSLTLPAIWYEAHLITPTTNVYGVTFPAVPGIVEGITPTTAWAFTNTGSDQLDTYRVQLSADGSRYLFDGEWRDLVMETDTIRVRGAAPQTVTVPFTHFGPVLREDDVMNSGRRLRRSGI